MSTLFEVMSLYEEIVDRVSLIEDCELQEILSLILDLISKVADMERTAQ